MAVHRTLFKFALFNLFINIFIVILIPGDIFCHIHDVFYGYFVYADNIMI